MGSTDAHNNVSDTDTMLSLCLAFYYGYTSTPSTTYVQYLRSFPEGLLGATLQ